MTPLMTPSEQKYMISALSQLRVDSRVTEWGSGGSTCMIAENMQETTSLLSIEHSRPWYEKTLGVIEKMPSFSRIRYVHVPTGAPYDSKTHPTREHGDAWLYPYGQPQEELPAFNREYIDPSVKIGLDFWDSRLYFVDGISRGAVLATISSKARDRDALVMVHDYTGREEWYGWAVSLFPSTVHRVDNLLVLGMR